MASSKRKRKRVRRVSERERERDGERGGVVAAGRSIAIGAGNASLGYPVTKQLRIVQRSLLFPPALQPSFSPYRRIITIENGATETPTVRMQRRLNAIREPPESCTDNRK